MARTKLVNGEPILFTAEEEAARDAEEAAAAIPKIRTPPRFEDDATAIEEAGTLAILKTALAAWARKQR